MTTAIVIPARLESTRIKRKPLAKLEGKPLVRIVAEHALESNLASQVIVSCDSPEVCDVIPQDKRLCVVHDPNPYRNGTERSAAALRAVGVGWESAVILQVDEPEISGEDLDRIIEYLSSEKGKPYGVITYGYRGLKSRDLYDRNLVKVATDCIDRALYFSRKPIPARWGHVGLYAVRKESLVTYANSWGETYLELAENLEQLRYLERGIEINILDLGRRVRGINTELDVRRYRLNYGQTDATVSPPC
jgi:3-deoxy-manno-octulosonate cytidylyltransferase (CMP-KDO synthetase)